MPRRKNLLKNNRAKGGLNDWEVVSSGGDGFSCENEPVGCKKINECTKIKANLGCWATSFELCSKYQLVNLPDCGRKSPITVRDWYSARLDCGGVYTLDVQLLADDKKTELASWSFKDTKEEGSEWTKVKHVFKDYPSGVRFVKFQHGGKDTKYWDGHYGIKMTNSAVFNESCSSDSSSDEGD